MIESIHTLVKHIPLVLLPVLRVAFWFSLLAVLLPRLTPRLFHAVENIFSGLADRRTLAVFVLFFAFDRD